MKIKLFSLFLLSAMPIMGMKQPDWTDQEMAEGRRQLTEGKASLMERYRGEGQERAARSLIAVSGASGVLYALARWFKPSLFNVPSSMTSSGALWLYATGTTAALAAYCSYRPWDKKVQCVKAYDAVNNENIGKFLSRKKNTGYVLYPDDISVITQTHIRYHLENK